MTKDQALKRALELDEAAAALRAYAANLDIMSKHGYLFKPASVEKETPGQHSSVQRVEYVVPADDLAKYESTADAVRATIAAMPKGTRFRPGALFGDWPEPQRQRAYSYVPQMARGALAGPSVKKLCNGLYARG